MNFLEYQKKELHIEGLRAASVALEFKTPLYVYSQSKIVERYRKLSHFFSLRPTLIAYALKANSNLHLCRILQREGAGAETVSGGELLLAYRAGFKSSQILFSGVGKTREEIRLGIKLGILSFNVESFEELKVISQEASKMRRVAPISVRINFPIEAKTHPHTMTSGRSSKFGVEEKEAFEIYRWSQKQRFLKIVGLHSHGGSQLFSATPYIQTVKLAGKFIRCLKEQNISLSFVDMGGGFGVGAVQAKGRASSSCFGECVSDREGKEAEEDSRLSQIARAYAREFKDFPSLKLIIEPGRFLVAESGILLTRIVYVKGVGKRQFLIVDAGMNDFLRPALYGARHPVIPVVKKKGKSGFFDVAGPVCESADFFVRGRKFISPQAGDLLAVLDVGAYGFSMSSHYNFRPRAAEVLVRGKTARLIRRRESFGDLSKTESR